MNENSRSKTGAARLSPEGYRKLLGEPGSHTRDTSEGLTWHDETGKQIGAQAPRPTAEMIREQARARDPQSWERAQRMRAQRGAAQVDSILLEAHVIATARDNGDLDDAEADRLFRANAMKLKAASPQAFAELTAQFNAQDAREREERYAAHVEVWGEDDDAAEEIFNPELAGDRLGREVAAAEADQRLAHSSAMIAGLLSRSDAAYVDVGREFVDPNDPQSVAEYQQMKQWIAEGGIDLDALVAAGKGEEAARYLRSGYGQRDEAVREQQLAEAKQAIVEDAPSTSVAEGLTTSSDAQSAQMQELIETIEEQNELKRVELGLSVPLATGHVFDPDWEPPVSREEQLDPPQTVGEFKESVLQPDERSVAHGFTDDSGNPISEDEAMRASKGIDGFPAPGGDRVVGIH
jgi:hypothetical protein